MSPGRLVAIRAVLVATASGLILAACGGGLAGQSQGDGVAPGAGKDEYLAAFEDIDPIELRIQTSGPEGSIDNEGKQQWADAVEEWSGGTITFEWGYGNSFVPEVAEQAAALADGRIDVGNFQPYNNPDEFPALSALSDATFLDGNRPTATLVSSGWLTDIVYSLPEYQDEAHASGVHILVAAPSASLTGIFCAEELTSLSDLSGVPVSASGQGRVTQLESLGMAPQSIAFTELYEGLQRGVVRCGSTTATAIDSMGAIEIVPYAITDPEASLVGFPVFLALGKNKWDSLPLVAQQLLFDLAGVYLEHEPTAQAQRNVEWLAEAQAAGGGVFAFADDARARMLQINQGLLDDIAERGWDADAFLEAQGRWDLIVNDELYADVTSDFGEFLEQGAFDDIDLQPFIDRLYEDVLAEQRPD